jgi:hypothetical protein
MAEHTPEELERMEQVEVEYMRAKNEREIRDDLLAALEGMMEELGEVAMTCGDRCRLCQGENDDIGQLQHTLDCPLTVAHAAIAKAKGG